MIATCKKILLVYLSLMLLIMPCRNVGAFTVGEEREVGEKLLYAVKSHFTVIDDPDLMQYIMALGDEVIETAGVQFFNYHFFIIDNKEFNAFAAPSGLIFFHSGLIEKMESENELVSVLAHEIGHVAKRHISSRIDKGKKISIATMGLLLASLALGGGAATEALFAGTLAAGESANLHFSRLDEEEADLLAYQWMKELGRNPDGQVRMLRTMRQIARYRSAMVPQYLLTHPNPENRLDYVQSLIDAEKSDFGKMARGDDINFLRFKYRILTQVKDSLFLRGYFSSILSSERVDEKNKIMAKYGLSLLESRENNYETSIKLMNEVIGAYPDKIQFVIDRGVTLLESGEVAEAYQVLEKAYNSNRNDMYSAFSLAKASYALGRNEEAAGLYKDVVYTFPKYSKAYFELGRISSLEGKKGETKYYLGKFYLMEGKLELAKKNLNEAVKISGLPAEMESDARHSLDVIERIEKK